MKRHAFDPVSAFFGVLIGGSALAVTLADARVFDLSSRWVWPGLLILAGVVLLVSGLGRDSER
jgi:hypothetical protein